MAALNLAAGTGEATMGLHGCSSVAAFGGRPPQPNAVVPYLALLKRVIPAWLLAGLV